MNLASRAENDAATASAIQPFLRNQQQESARATVVFSDKPWVSKKPLVAKRGLPLTMDCDITYRPSYNVGIAEIAHTSLVNVVYRSSVALTQSTQVSFPVRRRATQDLQFHLVWALPTT